MSGLWIKWIFNFFLFVKMVSVVFYSMYVLFKLESRSIVCLFGWSWFMTSMLGFWNWGEIKNKWEYVVEYLFLLYFDSRIHEHLSHWKLKMKHVLNFIVTFCLLQLAIIVIGILNLLCVEWFSVGDGTRIFPIIRTLPRTFICAPNGIFLFSQCFSSFIICRSRFQSSWLLLSYLLVYICLKCLHY